MSELITQRPGVSDFRWHLLATVSALTLLASTASEARAEDGNRPTVWIELGGQLSRLENGQVLYTPPFVALTPSDFTPPQEVERPPRYGFDVSAALTIQPQGSDWAFSASLRYGRSGNSKHVRQQSYPGSNGTGYVHVHQLYFGRYIHNSVPLHVPPIAARFTDAVTKQSESRVILDFQAGKDLGIGLFGHNSSSNLGLGVRFAQFISKSRAKIGEDPDWQFKQAYNTFSTSYLFYGSLYTLYRKEKRPLQAYHSFAGAFQADRSFEGLGPSISLKSSVPFVGNPQDGGLSLDWGVNAGLLFGRQKTKTSHQTTGRYHSPGTAFNPNVAASLVTTYQHVAVPRTRTRNVAVPNVGGFAGLSFNYADAKVSFGYKADFFFGAMDGGIDVRRTEDVGFHGPYASVSIGLGG